MPASNVACLVSSADKSLIGNLPPPSSSEMSEITCTGTRCMAYVQAFNPIGCTAARGGAWGGVADAQGDGCKDVITLID